MKRLYKRLYKRLLTLVPLLIMCLFVSAQPIKPLKIGDQVPDMVLKQMLNHKTGSGKLSDFKGKAIIIDQWFISCAPCVSSMPHLDSLQKEFSNELQILPVTFEKKKNVEQFWASHPVVRGIKLSQVVEDTLVRSYFPAVSFPQQIWIDKIGKVVAITDGNTTNRENIRKLISGERLKLDVKSDEMDPKVRFASEPTMLIRYPENKEKLLHYSYISKYRKELAGMAMSKVDTISKLVRVFNNNNSLFGLYDFAYANNSWEMRHMPTRFIRKDTKPIKSTIETMADTVDQFCYDLMYTGTSTAAFNKYMIPDLDRFFGIKSHEELMDIVCYAIRQKGTGKKYRQIYQPERKTYHIISLSQAKRVIVNNVPLFLVEHAINQTSEYPILLEIDGKGRINFDVRWDLNHLDLMNEDLEKFNLYIEKTIRKRKVIILEDM